jgi:hypothetical protein
MKNKVDNKRNGTFTYIYVYVVEYRQYYQRHNNNTPFSSSLTFYIYYLQQ